MQQAAPEYVKLLTEGGFGFLRIDLFMKSTLKLRFLQSSNN